MGNFDEDIEENPQWREQRDQRRKLRMEAQEDAAACMARRDSAAHFASMDVHMTLDGRFGFS